MSLVEFVAYSFVGLFVTALIIIIGAVLMFGTIGVGYVLAAIIGAWHNLTKR